MVGTVHIVEDASSLVKSQLDSTDFRGYSRHLKEISQLADSKLHNLSIACIGESLMQCPKDSGELLLCDGRGHQNSGSQRIGLPFHPIQFAGKRAIVALVVLLHHSAGDGADSGIEKLLELEEFVVLVPVDALVDDGVVI